MCIDWWYADATLRYATLRYATLRYATPPPLHPHLLQRANLGFPKKEPLSFPSSSSLSPMGIEPAIDAARHDCPALVQSAQAS